MHVILLIKHSEYEFQRFIVRNWRRGEIGKERERGKNLQYIDHRHLKYKVIESLFKRTDEAFRSFSSSKKMPECKY